MIKSKKSQFLFYIYVYCIKIIHLILIILITSPSYAAIELDVSPEGSLSSLWAARDKVRQLRDKGEKGDITVWIHDGIYNLNETLIFNTKDSAPEGAYTYYRALKNTHPVISGGRVIDNWEKITNYPSNLPEAAQGKVWIAMVPWAKNGHKFHCLFNGKKILTRAKSRRFNIAGPRGRYTDKIIFRQEFTYKDGIKNWPNLNDIELFISPYKKWLVNYLPLSEVNEQTKKARLTVPATYSMRGRYIVANCIEYLDRAGEWVLDSYQGILYYWPVSGKPGKNIIATFLDEIIRIEGKNDSTLEGKNDLPVRGLVFQGLIFSYADRQQWEPDDIGIQHDWNMWDKENGMIRFRGAKECGIDHCTFQDSGSDGIRLDLYCQNITIRNSFFTNIGGTGILLAGYGPGLKDVNHHNIIIDNELTDVGTFFWHSPGIFVWQSGHNRIAHNHIYNQGYSGLIISGVRRRFFDRLHDEMAKAQFRQWNFPEGTREHIPTIRWDEIKLSDTINWEAYEPYMHARKNVIEYNEIHDCMKRLHDGNAIYLSAHGDGNIVRRNVTYNHPKSSMIRTDDDSHGVTVEENFFFGTIVMDGMKMKGLNTIRNNIFINSVTLTGRIGNTADPNSLITHNIYYHTVSKLSQGFHKGLKMLNNNINYNLYFHKEQGQAKKFLTIQQQMAPGMDSRSIVADPMFMDIENGDFSLKKNSPALKLGIKSIPRKEFAKIGCKQNRFINRMIASKDKWLNPKNLKPQK